VNVDHHERQNHFLQADLIDGPQTFNKMGRWIDMRAPLADVGKNLSKESCPE
jgi:hypothetical protein